MSIAAFDMRHGSHIAASTMPRAIEIARHADYFRHRHDHASTMKKHDEKQREQRHLSCRALIDATALTIKINVERDIGETLFAGATLNFVSELFSSLLFWRSAGA